MTLPAYTDPWWLEAPIAEICRPIGVIESGRVMEAKEAGAATLSANRAGRRKKWDKITAGQRAQIVHLVKTGATYSEAAADTGVSESQVAIIAKEAGVARGRGRQKGGPTCAVPGCGNQLTKTNRSGVCRGHNHAHGYCRCPKCVG